MDPIKCFDVLVAAVGQVLRADGSARRRLRLVIVGDGPMYSDVSARIQEAGLDDVAFLTGRRNDIPDVLRSLDVFVLASRNEGISNTLLEAMATGLPVIATDVGGNSELIDDRITGYLVPSNAPGKIASAIRRYLDNDELRRNHGRAARSRAEEHFSLNRMVAGYRQLYDRYLHNDNQPRVQ
jgi:glycosyltransferase involved in cell wall biosynthesis